MSSYDRPHRSMICVLNRDRRKPHHDSHATTLKMLIFGPRTGVHDKVAIVFHSSMTAHECLGYSGILGS